jgi:hypothetical protein
MVWKESSPGSGVWSVEATLTGHSEHRALRGGRCGWTLRLTGSWDKTVKGVEGVDGELALVRCVERRGDPHGVQRFRLLRVLRPNNGRDGGEKG